MPEFSVRDVDYYGVALEKLMFSNSAILQFLGTFSHHPVHTLVLTFLPNLSNSIHLVVNAKRYTEEHEWIEINEENIGIH